MLFNGEDMGDNDPNDQQERLMQSFISTMSNNHYDNQRIRNTIQSIRQSVYERPNASRVETDLSNFMHILNDPPFIT